MNRLIHVHVTCSRFMHIIHTCTLNERRPRWPTKQELTNMKKELTLKWNLNNEVEEEKLSKFNNFAEVLLSRWDKSCRIFLMKGFQERAFQKRFSCFV